MQDSPPNIYGEDLNGSNIPFYEFHRDFTKCPISWNSMKCDEIDFHYSLTIYYWKDAKTIDINIFG